MGPILIFFLVLAGIIITLCAIMYWALIKRRATLRLLAAMFGILTLSLGGFLGYSMQDNTFFLFAIGIAIFQGLLILAIPRISPNQFKMLEKNLGLRW